jgi:ribosomal 50S subunit-recycling heat shock protein
MTRWFRKRWALAALVGATVTLGVASTRGADAPHKVGDVISLNFGNGEKQVQVLKIEKQADGSFHSEVKDQKTGETFTLVDRPENAPPAGAPKGTAPTAPKGTAPGTAKQPAPPQAKPRTTDPLMPSPSATPDLSKDKAKEPEKEKRPLLGRLFGDRDKSAAPDTSASMKPAEPTEPPKRTGLLSRVFGSKKPDAPAASTSAMVPAAKPSAPAAVVPTPGGLGRPATGEPPRAMPATKPVVPPAPVVPVPSAPSAAPAFPKPAPLPLPTVPSIPAPLPSAPPLPGIPVPPGGTSSAPPAHGVVPVGHAVPGAQPPLVITPPLGQVPAGVAFDREVQPWVAQLQTAIGPSERLLAAQALANCRHCGTDGVKGALFEAAKRDPNGEVRAACITHLCKLGFYDAQFRAHIEAACTDANADVCAAAKAACAKMLKK